MVIPALLENEIPKSLNQIKVLLSAFACEPGRGSEQEVGWRWALELSRELEVTVLTQERNRPAIERALAAGAGAGAGRRLRFEYLQLPQPLPRLKSRFDFLTLPYYASWQWLAMVRARELHAAEPFALIHHLTFASFRVPIWMRRVGPPVVMGPVGGAERAPWHLLGYRSTWRSWTREAFRNTMTGASVALLRGFPPLAGGKGLCLAATPGMLRIFERQGLPCRLFPTIGAEGGAEPAPLRTADGRCRFLFVGRLHLLKGVQLLLTAFADPRLAEATLTLVGGGPEERRLKEQAAELGLAARVSWLGVVPREQLADVYRAHDVLVAPSLYESGGLAVLEAMEHALPSIVLDVGGHAVSVTDECGIKVPVGQPLEAVVAALADGMAAYAGDPERRRNDGQHGRARVAEVYGWETKLARMLDIYRQLAGGGTEQAGGAEAGSGLEIHDVTRTL